MYNYIQSNQYIEQINFSFGISKDNNKIWMASIDITFLVNTNTKSLNIECINSKLGNPTHNIYILNKKQIHIHLVM